MYPAKLSDLPHEVRHRASLERRIVRSLVREFAAQGFTFIVDDGDALITCPNAQAALRALLNTDEDYLGIIRDSQEIGCIRLVYGNDGWDVICDYDTNLEPFMPRTLALVDKLSQ